jgi:protein-tyrosine phosphatase
MAAHVTPHAASMVDLHTHLLPGVDDGVRTLAEALEELRKARLQGTAAIVCTPHIHPHWSVDSQQLLDERRRIHERLLEAAAAEGGLPEIGLGSEVLIDDAAPALDHPGLRLNGTPYALVEVGFLRERFDSLQDIFRQLLDRDWRPVLAHVERYPHLRHCELLVAWREDGVLAQVNASSLAGVHGPDISDRAWDLVERGLADLVASDVHGPHMRLNHLGEAWSLVAARAGIETAQRLFVSTPSAVYHGRVVASSG